MLALAAGLQGGLSRGPSTKPVKSPRLLWEVRTGGGRDRFFQLAPTGEKLLGLRAGVLYALDPQSGKELWRFPGEGLATGAISEHAILRVVGDCAITELPEHERGRRRGIVAIRISDGVAVREFWPELEVRYMRLSWRPPFDKHLLFWGCPDDRFLTSVVVFDLANWRESARFELPEVHPPLYVSQGRVFGLMERRGEGFRRAFTVHLKSGRMYSVPIRYAGSARIPLPDGGYLVSEGRISATCAYERPWPGAEEVEVVDGGVYGRDEQGLYRADPRDGRKLWRFYPGIWRGRNQSPLLSRNIAAAAGVVAFYERCYLHIVDAGTGSLRAAVRVLEKEASIPCFRIPVACDGPRAYFASPTVLKCCSTRPVDPERPDPKDPGDPAYALARCRRALLRSDFEGALKAIRGIGPLVGLRRSHREEAVELLSQLSRSPAGTFYPGLWTEVMLADGWIAGELFLEDYRKLAPLPRHGRAVSALIAVGGERALRAANELVVRGLSNVCLLHVLAEAAEDIPGLRPMEDVISRGFRRGWREILKRPVDDDTFARILLKLRAMKLHGKPYYVRKLTPRQVLSLFEGEELDEPVQVFSRPVSLIKAARLHAASMARGEGEKESIDIWRPPEAVEEF